MRTTQKAAPLVAIGVAGLLGLAAQQALGQPAQAAPQTRPPARVALVAAPVGARRADRAGRAAAGARAGAVERQLVWKQDPHRLDGGRHADSTASWRPTRAPWCCPGQIFAYYTWGGTVDAILPRLTNRPVAVRYETPYSDPHAFDLLATVDGLVQQRRLVPGQLSPLLRLMGVGAVVTGSRRRHHPQRRDRSGRRRRRAGRAGPRPTLRAATVRCSAVPPGQRGYRTAPGPAPGAPL